MTGRGSRRWILAITLMCGAYALAIGLTGGFDARVAGIRLRSHSWSRPTAVALVGAAVLAWRSRRRAHELLPRAWSELDSPTTVRILTIAALSWTGFAAAAFGTFAVGGSDSYGYISQANLFAHGRLTGEIPTNREFPWPDAEASFTPLAYTRGQSPGVIAPTYPPGLPLLMVPFTSWDGGVFWIVPFFGVLAVWLASRVGVEIGDPLAGGFAAVLLSLSPTFLFQLFQPMSDVPAAACWIGAALLGWRRSLSAATASGALVALAVLIRPNLAPLTIVIAVALASDGERRWQRVAAFGLSILPAVVMLGWIQSVRYGAPWASGYGSIQELFSAANVIPNLARYPRWLTETHTPFIWLWLAAPLWIAKHAIRPVRAWTPWALSLAVCAAYLPYAVFEASEWHYTRFLLPAIPIMLIFAAVLFLSLVRRLPIVARAPVAVTLLAVVGSAQIHSARAHGAFDIRREERRYPEAGRFVRDRLPGSTFVLAVQHSGSIRYYANRPTLRWDRLDPSRLDETLAILRKKGFTPVLVADAGEDAEFRRRFTSAARRGALNLTPLGEFGAARVYGFD